MKLRIYGNSVRLRISESDLAGLENEGHIECWTGFGPDQKLVYSLETDPDIDRLSAEFVQDALTLRMPADWVAGWSANGKVGFEGMQPIDGDQQLHLIVEKDLECRHAPSDEEDRFARTSDT